jgi:hypothetical protein
MAANSHAFYHASVVRPNHIIGIKRCLENGKADTTTLSLCLICSVLIIFSLSCIDHKVL